MANPITEAITRANGEGRKALVPFLMAGHPAPEAFAGNLDAAAEFADVIEVGVPFSDPLADGPVIQAAAAKALEQRMTLSATLDVLRQRESGPPVVLMLSFNQVFAGGVDRFAQRVAEAKVSGAIIPDLPFGESREVSEIFDAHGLTVISMLAPTTPEPRMQAVLSQARGFIYLVSVAGVTGTRDTYPQSTLNYLARARELSTTPTCVGFGISQPKHIHQLRESADGFIVGSALIRTLDNGGSVADTLAPLRQACDAQITEATQ